MALLETRNYLYGQKSMKKGKVMTNRFGETQQMVP